MASSAKDIENIITFNFDKALKKKFNRKNIDKAADAIGQELLFISLENAISGKRNDGKKLKVSSNTKYLSFKKRVIKRKLKMPKGERKRKKYKYKKWKTVKRLNNLWAENNLTHANKKKDTTRLTGELWASLRYEVIVATSGGLFRPPKIQIKLFFAPEQEGKVKGLLKRGYKIMTEYKFTDKQMGKIKKAIQKKVA